MTKRVKPPRLARLLVRMAAPSADVKFVIDDLEEEFETRLDAHGVRVAHAWYWSETMRSFIPLIARRWQLATRNDPTQRRRDPMFISLLGDARHTLRLARRSPLASLAVIATMALGIGATTAVFSAMNGILL